MHLHVEAEPSFCWMPILDAVPEPMGRQLIIPRVIPGRIYVAVTSFCIQLVLL